MNQERPTVNVYQRSLIILLGCLLLAWLVRKFINSSKIGSPQKKMIIINKTGEDVYFLLIENGFNYRQARYIVAQAAHETLNFSSRIFRENNNLFGMKLALVRKTTAVGQKYGHAIFTDIESCVKDFKIYYTGFKYLPVYPSVAAYVTALKAKGYFEASLEAYIEAVEYFYNLYFESNE